MEILFKRSDYIYIIKKENAFYLVNLKENQYIKAKPSNLPDMFLKFGYWEEVKEEEITEECINQINEIMK